MTKRKLSEELRERQRTLETGADPVDKLSDEKIIWAYNACSSCGRLAIPIDDLDMVIEDIADAEEFVDRLDNLDSVEPGKAHKAGCPEAKAR